MICRHSLGLSAACSRRSAQSALLSQSNNNASIHRPALLTQSLHSCSHRPAITFLRSSSPNQAESDPSTGPGNQEPSKEEDDSSSSSTSTQDTGLVAGPLGDNSLLSPELQNLRITEDGELVDDLTGKTVNAFGAGRWDVHVRALRGELDPPSWVEDTEASQGNIMAALFQFPREHCFQVVGSGGELFVDDAIAIVEQTCQERILREKLKVTPRLGGKYSSFMMDIKVRAPEIIEMVHEKLRKDPRVKMCF